MADNGEAFETDVEQRNGTTVVRVSGELDIINARELKSLALGLLRQGRRWLVLDLREVPFIDSGAVGVLAGVHHVFKDHFGSVTLTGLTPRVFRVLCITGMDRSLNIEQAERA